jgi:hypothetical protein
LSVSSACLFLGIIFLVSLWISHKNFKNFWAKKQLFFSLWERTRYKKKRNSQATTLNDRCVPEKERKTKRDTNKGTKLFRVLTMTRQFWVVVPHALLLSLLSFLFATPP